MLVKTCPAKIKAVGGEDGLQDGQFTAVVSVFGNVDVYGDMVMPGAFKDTLAEWAESGDPIPVLYSHNSGDPDYNIGHVLTAEETDEGLQILAQLDIESDTGKARQVHRLLTGKRVKQFSFAYDVLDGAPVEQDGQSIYELRKMKLYDVGPTLIGANQETRLIGAKDATVVDAAQAVNALAAEMKAGRVLSASNESRIRTAVEELSTVLDTLPEPKTSGPESGDTSTQSPAGEPAKAEEPFGAKAEEPMPAGPDDVLAALTIKQKETQ